MRILFLALALALVSWAQADLSDTEQEHLRTVLGQSSNSPQDIIRALELHLAKFPNSPKRADIERALAKAAIDTKDERRIALYGEKVLQRDPDDTSILDQVCRALIRMGDKESAGRALEYARRYEKAVASSQVDKGATGAQQARIREQLDNAMWRSLILQGQALAILGDLDQAIALGRRAFDAYPSATPAWETGGWLVRAGRMEEAARVFADAFTVPDPKTTDTDRAAYRRSLGEAYTKWKGSEAGLGDLVLQAYDRNLAKIAQRQLALKQYDPNLGLTNPMDFTLTSEDGGKLSLSSLAGKVVVLDFWATWCGPCRIQYPMYEEVKEKYAANKDVVFLGINTDEDHQVVKPFLLDQKWNKRAYFEDGLDQALRISSIPTTIVIDRRGVIASRMNGFDPESFVNTLSNRIEEALK